METIEDIISEMRRNGVVHDPRHFNELCDRIAEAWKRADAHIIETMQKVRDENARLRDALKTVLEFPTDESKWWNLNLMYKNAFRAISYAQELYNERTAKK